MAAENNLFYIYDTMTPSYAFNAREHRLLLADIAKRTKYFWVWPAKSDQPWETGKQSEFGPRFFEGAASGCILFGDAPDTPEFKKHFGWPDAVLRVPLDGMNLSEVLNDINLQPNRYEEIRRNNIVKCLLNHDLMYRWKQILKIIGLEARPALFTRESYLQKLARIVSQSYQK
jgi:hypothetical protein